MVSLLFSNLSKRQDLLHPDDKHPVVSEPTSPAQAQIQAPSDKVHATMLLIGFSILVLILNRS